jgi:hypothetical protein
MAERHRIVPEDIDELDRERLADEFMHAWDAFSDQVRCLPEDEQDRFVREWTEAIDDGIRTRVERLDRAANRLPAE